VRKADNLPPSSAVVMKSGNLNYLEPSGPLQSCNGTALPLPVGDTEIGRQVLTVFSFIIYIYFVSFRVASDKTVTGLLRPLHLYNSPDT